VNVTLDGITVTIDGAEIVGDVSVEIRSGEMHGVVGPNGSGKSTLLRCLYRALRPASGRAMIDGDDIWRQLTARQAAQRRAIVPQDSSIDFDFSVRETVSMGRSPHQRLLDRNSATDTEIIDDALDTVAMTTFGARLVSTLSGGERQRVLLARALAQQAPVLVLDEPTNHLDIRAQLELLELVRSLPTTTIAALHDLDHAASLCGTVTVLAHGRVVASGPPDEVLTPDVIAQVFGVRAHVGTHPLTGRPHITVATRPDEPASDTDRTTEP